MNDAFGTSHRAHASVAGVPALMSDDVCGLGCLVTSELSYLDFSTKKEGEIIAAGTLILRIIVSVIKRAGMFRI